MVPWSHWRQPCLGWLMIALTSEFTHFNLVIHLFPFFTFYDVLPFLLSLETAVILPFCVLAAVPNNQKHFCFAAAQAFETFHNMQGRYMLSRCGDLFSWWLSGEVKHFVHLIRLNLNSRLCPCDLTWPRSLWGNNARTCKLAELNLFNNFVVSLSSPTIVPHSVPNSSPVPLGNVLWGSGVCSVFVRSFSPCRLVLEVRLFPSPPCAVPALARRLCPLFSSSCLSGFTRSDHVPVLDKLNCWLQFLLTAALCLHQFNLNF